MKVLIFDPSCLIRVILLSARKLDLTVENAGLIYKSSDKNSGNIGVVLQKGGFSWGYCMSQWYKTDSSGAVLNREQVKSKNIFTVRRFSPFLTCFKKALCTFLPALLHH